MAVYYKCYACGILHLLLLLSQSFMRANSKLPNARSQIQLFFFLSLFHRKRLEMMRMWAHVAFINFNQIFKPKICLAYVNRWTVRQKKIDHIYTYMIIDSCRVNRMKKTNPVEKSVFYCSRYAHILICWVLFLYRYTSSFCYSWNFKCAMHCRIWWLKRHFDYFHGICSAIAFFYVFFWYLLSAE